jgi:hypothetical protein
LALSGTRIRESGGEQTKRVDEGPWYPRFRLSSLSLAVLMACLFLGALFGMNYTSYESSAAFLINLAVLNSLSPIARWWLPTTLRWSLWTFVYLGLFVGAKQGINYTEGVWLGVFVIATAVGAFWFCFH